jgi:hypothetical protein
MTEVPHIPAPWDLKGRGYIILYRFTKEEINLFLPRKAL